MRLNKNQIKFFSNIKKRNQKILIGTLMIIFFELFIFNSAYFSRNVINLEQQEFNILDGNITGYNLVDGSLISKHNDPKIIFDDVDILIDHLFLVCSDVSKETSSQIFFRKENQAFNEDMSVSFSIEPGYTFVQIPGIKKIDSLRLDLTNKENSYVVCEKLILNPEINYTFSTLQLLFYFIVILIIVFWERIIKQGFLKNVGGVIVNKGFWIFFTLIIIISFSYPITLSADSIHYIIQSKVILQANWEKWDPIRYLLFPLIIFLSNILFGYSLNALLIPMVLASLLLYLTSVKLILVLFRINDHIHKFLIYLIVFLLISTNTIIFGYYHLLLTEYVAATASMVTILLCQKLLDTSFLNKRFIYLSSLFPILITFMWHIKQPYIGATFFPVSIFLFLILFKTKFSKKAFLYALILTLTIAVLVFGSTSLWNKFLINQGNTMREDRKLSTFVGNKLSSHLDQIKNSPKSFIKDLLGRYFASFNFFDFNRENQSVIISPSLNRSYQNRIIASRIYLKPNQLNIFHSDNLDHHTLPYQSRYNPPLWLNKLFLMRLNLDQSIFTFSYLVLPIFLFINLLLIISKNDKQNSFLIILAGSAFLNIFIQILYSPIDRYLFWGFPLLLIYYLSMVFYLTPKFQVKTWLKKRK